MAMIPSDAGIRMRMQTETGLPALAPVRGIPADLPDLQPGQVFSARIQEVMPENTYRALVAGKEITLSLPHGAKNGDVLELVVQDRTPKAIVAQLATPPELKPGVVFTAIIQEALPDNKFRALAGEKRFTLSLDQPAQPGETLELTVIDRSSQLLEAKINQRLGQTGSGGTYQFTTLSPAAQLIGKLLVTDGETPQAAPLNGGQALFQATASAAEIAPRLAQAIEQSGLFYESHQVQWAMGKRSTEALLQEPQGQQGTSAPAFSIHASGRTPRETSESAQTTTNIGPLRTPEGIPETLRPLVQQQLDAAATQRLIWHGELWPGQSMEWEVRRESPEQHTAQADWPEWTTRLALTTPRLGKVEARLQLTGTGLNLLLSTQDEASASELRQAGETLQNSLEAAGLNLRQFLVRPHE